VHLRNLRGRRLTAMRHATLSVILSASSLVALVCPGCGPPPLEWPAIEEVRIEPGRPTRGRIALPSTYEAFLRGQIAFQGEDYDEAVRQFRTALRTDPESAYLLAWTARALLALGRVPDAQESVDRALEADPCAELAWCVAAEILVARDDTAGAMRALRRAIECEPRQPEAYFELAALLERGGAARRAAEVISSLLVHLPDDSRARDELARLALAQGDTAGAVRHLSALLDLEPGRADAIRTLARVYTQRGDTAAATALLETVVSRDPRNDDTRRALIRTLLTARDTDRAAHHIALLHSAEGSAAEVAALADLYLEAQRPESAEREARAALEIDASHPLAGAVLVGALREQGNVDAAVAAYGRLDPQQPETDRAAREAALGLWESGRPAEARALLERFLTEHSPASRELLARLLESQGLIQAAEDVLRAGQAPQDRVALGALLLRQGRSGEVLDLFHADAGSTRELVVLGRAMLEAGEPGCPLDRTEDVARRARSRSPNDPSALALLGAVASVRGHHDEALELLRRAEELEPESIWIRTRLATALHQAGRDTEAADEARRALRLHPDERHRELLEQLAGGAGGDGTGGNPFLETGISPEPPSPKTFKQVQE
jgi:tetratricopeptide (TPR) repeat protein